MSVVSFSCVMDSQWWISNPVRARASYVGRRTSPRSTATQCVCVATPLSQVLLRPPKGLRVGVVHVPQSPLSHVIHHRQKGRQSIITMYTKTCLH